MEGAMIFGLVILAMIIIGVETNNMSLVESSALLKSSLLGWHLTSFR